MHKTLASLWPTFYAPTSPRSHTAHRGTGRQNPLRHCAQPIKQLPRLLHQFSAHRQLKCPSALLCVLHHIHTSGYAKKCCASKQAGSKWTLDTRMRGYDNYMPPTTPPFLTPDLIGSPCLLSSVSIREQRLTHTKTRISHPGGGSPYGRTSEITLLSRSPSTPNPPPHHQAGSRAPNL